MPEQEQRENRSNAHAKATLQLLQDASDEGIDASDAIEDLTADRETYQCASCDRHYFSRAEAFRCCRSSGPQGGEPA